MSWLRPKNNRNEYDELMQLIDTISRSPGPRTHDAVNRLKAYGIACLELLIRETKIMKYPGTVSGIRDSVFTAMPAADALPITARLCNDNDPDVRLVAAIAISMFNYEGREDLKSTAIGAQRYVQRRAQRDGDNDAKQRIDELIAEIDFQECSYCHAHISRAYAICPRCDKHL